MKVRVKNPLQTAEQFFVENAEELRDWTGGVLMWDRRAEDGSPRPYLRLHRDASVGSFEASAHVGDWIVQEGPKFRVYINEVFQREFDKEWE